MNELSPGANHAMRVMREDQEARKQSHDRWIKTVNMVFNIGFILFVVWWAISQTNSSEQRHQELIDAISPTTQLRSDLEGHSHFPTLPFHTHPGMIPGSFGAAPVMDTGTTGLPDSIFPFSPEFKKLIDSANIGWRKSEVNNIEFGLRIPKDAAIDTRMVDSMLERWFNSLGYSMYPPEPPINSKPARVD